MKRFVGLLLLIFFLFSLQEINAYQITINATSDVDESTDTYSLRIWNLNNYDLFYNQGSLTSPTTISFSSPGDYVLYGYYITPGDMYSSGHFYYGDYDELTIISLTDENPSETIDIHILDGHGPHHFKTYDIMDINGHDVIPIFQDFIYSMFTKQLVYENDNNEIMLIGYQQYTPNGWETTLAEEEFLYLDNNAQAGNSFTSHNYLLWEGGIFFSPSSMYVRGAHEVSFNDNTYSSTAVEMHFTSMMDMWYEYWYEFTGNEAPLLRNHRQEGSSHTIYDTNYDGELDYFKLLNLTPNIETVYAYEGDMNSAPKNLTYINDTFYWYPPSQYAYITNEYQIDQIFYWQHDFNNETILDSLVLSSGADEYEFDDTNIAYANYSFWVRAMLQDGTLTEPTNIIPWSFVANEDNDSPALSKLQDNYPNPFNPETTISFNIPKSGNVSLEIYNIKGQRVKTLIRGFKTAGEHSIVWNGRDDDNKSVASGIYLYKMRSGTYSSSKKMILMK